MGKKVGTQRYTEEPQSFTKRKRKENISVKLCVSSVYLCGPKSLIQRASPSVEEAIRVPTAKHYTDRVPR